MEHNFKDFQKIESQESLSKFITRFRTLAKNEGSNNENKRITEKIIEKCLQLDDKKSLVMIYEVKVSLMEHLADRVSEISKIVSEMKELSNEINYVEGLALAYNVEWYIEKLKGNTKKSKKALEKSINNIKKNPNPEEYAFHVCRYSLAVENWLNDHNIESAIILEECSSYFFKEGHYRSFAQVLGLLSIIYTRIHESKKILHLSNQIFCDRFLFEGLPYDVQGIIYYFTGLGHMLDANLAMAESYFNEAHIIFKPIYKNSIYFAYYLVLLSHIATVKGLQGKTEQSTTMVKETSKTLQTKFIKKNLDKNSKKQITHTHNLTNFYNLSRLSRYNPQELQELINEIVKKSENLYSDFMTFSEFILNSELDSDTLLGLLKADNFSINRIKHLIKFKIEQQKPKTEISKEQRSLNCISILKAREVTSKTTFMEHAYADLMIAQELFSLKRYAEITPLLKKYENRLNQIEVLEMRIFMEAFIQVGAYKNGDPLGPALQYMAIKKCRNHGFSRLENKLLDYLQLQRMEITKAM